MPRSIYGWILIAGILAVANPLLADDLVVHAYDGRNIHFKATNGAPDPIETPDLRFDTVGMLMDASGSKAIWVVGGQLKKPGHYEVTVSSLLYPELHGFASVDKENRFSFHGWDSGESSIAWSWLDDPGTTYFPVTVHVKNEDTAQAFDVDGCGAFNGAVKTMICQAIKWGAVAVKLPDGSDGYVPVLGEKIRHTDNAVWRASALTLTKSQTHGWVWTLNGALKIQGETTIKVESPLAKGWSQTFTVSGPGAFSLEFAPQTEVGSLWVWTQNPSTDWVPFKITATSGVWHPEATEWACLPRSLKSKFAAQTNETASAPQHP